MMEDINVGTNALSITVKASNISKYPAKQHARSVVNHLGVKSGLIYLLGAPSKTLEDSDQPAPFRQRRFFFYLSGVDFPGCILTYDIAKDDLRLFIPPVVPWEAVWISPTPNIQECEEKYDVDCVSFTGEANDYVLDWHSHNMKLGIYVLHKEQAPKSMRLDCHNVQIGSLEEVLDWKYLKPAMEAARVIKSDHEVDLIRRANQITAYAHRSVLVALRYNSMDNETQLEAAFQAACLWRGAKKQAYGIIAGSGTNASILHYVANNQPLAGRQLVCMDAGCEWECYASDVTRTFPISGKFSAEAREIYHIVEKMQNECIRRVKPGVIFRDLHVLAMEIAVKGLMQIRVLCNGTFEEVLPTGVAFFPHGLGHHLGLECHDVYDTQRLLLGIDTVRDLQKQRSYFSKRSPEMARETSPKPYDRIEKLAANMVITVEPGIYFSRYALEKFYLNDPKHVKYIDKEALERYYPVGGVRIEDNILVTPNGNENLTTAPKGEEACRIIRGDSPDPLQPTPAANSTGNSPQNLPSVYKDTPSFTREYSNSLIRGSEAENPGQAAINAILGRWGQKGIVVNDDDGGSYTGRSDGEKYLELVETDGSAAGSGPRQG